MTARFLMRIGLGVVGMLLIVMGVGVWQRPLQAQVLACLRDDYDVDDNWRVNIRDILLVAGDFGTNSHSPTRDIDCDGSVAVADIQLVAAHWLCTDCIHNVVLLSSWMLNTSSERSLIRDAGGQVLVNVQGVYTQTVSGAGFACIQATGIPGYETQMTSTLVNELNSRPKAATDFVGGQTTATVGQLVRFGQDIGYRSRNTCVAGAGYGYWPPGPACPTNQNRTACFPLIPAPTSADCPTGMGSIGMWVNGTAIFNWADGFSYLNQNVWHNDANHLEHYDVDICPGHSANGNYHHHGHPECLQHELSDVGAGHSPVYGFAADGYPVYGPWVAPDTLAVSCWKPRDYDNPTSPTGCGVAGARSCLLVDQSNPSLGTTPAAQPGPRTDATVTSLSGNTFVATSGFYLEDYYYDAACSAQGLAALDEHNGHDHDGLGYHYHVTISDNGDGTYNKTFPYHIGPLYRGALPANSFARCGNLP
jgi:hypothetical protein